MFHSSNSVSKYVRVAFLRQNNVCGLAIILLLEML